MILDLSGFWDGKKHTATTGYTPEATEKWEIDWWSRHMAHNEGEESSDLARVRANRAQVDPTQPKVHGPYRVPGDIPDSLAAKSWPKDSFHVAEYAECRKTGYSIPIFRSGFNADRRFNDRDFNTYTSEKIILDNMNMVPAAHGAPMGPEPRHKAIVRPVERQQRPNRTTQGDRGYYRDSRNQNRHEDTRYQDGRRRVERHGGDSRPNHGAPRNGRPKGKARETENAPEVEAEVVMSEDGMARGDLNDRVIPHT